jgi:hypothetical protein
LVFKVIFVDDSASLLWFQILYLSTVFSRVCFFAVHTKWSPVATASYRLLPDPQLKRHDDFFRGERAKELVAICPMRVFDLEDMVRFLTYFLACFVVPLG